MFHAILSAQKKFDLKFFFHPKFFWMKQGATQCYQAFLLSDFNSVGDIKAFSTSCLSRDPHRFRKAVGWVVKEYLRAEEPECGVQGLLGQQSGVSFAWIATGVGCT